MPIFRKKPVKVEAIQWTGHNLAEIIRFTGPHGSKVAKEGLKIFTLEGPLTASIGDWIIRGVSGEFYPCKPDIFDKTYDEE